MTFRRSRRVLGTLVLLGLVLCTLNMLKLNNEEHEYSSLHLPSDGFVVQRQAEVKPHGQASRKLLKQGPPDHHIVAPETYHLEYELTGAVFKEGRSLIMVRSPVVSCLIHLFSPSIEKSAGSRFVDPEHGNIFYANSPAVTWYGEELVLVIRIWLDRERYEKDKNWPVNHFADNYFYTQKFTKYLEPVDSGHILGIPMPKQFWVGDGPIEPRLIQVNDTLLISFNAGIGFKKDYFVDWTIFWDYFKSRPIIPDIKGGSPVLKGLEPDAIPCDKHWMPFEAKGKLYFIHSLDPLRVLNCQLDGKCHFILEPSGNFSLKDQSFHFRGGTPLELYKWPYYIGFAHSTLYKQDGKRYYTVNLLVLSFKPLRIVYISDPIEIHEDIYNMVPMVRKAYIKDNFIFPVGIILEDEDSVVLGAHVNDHSSMLFRIHGIKKLMKLVIDVDQKEQAEKEAPPMFIQSYIHDRLQKVTGYKFEP